MLRALKGAVSQRALRHVSTRAANASGSNASGAAHGAVLSRSRSLLEPDIERCADCAAVLRVGASTSLPLGLVDLRCFLQRLKALKKMPHSGTDLRQFLAKVEEGLPAMGAEGAFLALSSFAELRCRQGAVFAWPLVLQRRKELPATWLAESVWAASAVPAPPKELLYEAVGLARDLTGEVKTLPEEALYRVIYGLARIHTGRGSSELLKQAQRGALQLLRREPCKLAPRQRVRLCWALARLGCQNDELFEALELRLQPVLDRLQLKELEALYGILTELERVKQWKLIHDVERAIESRPESAENDVKRPRKHAFRKRWTRDDLLHTVLPKKR
ncbi:unnamed protein product [Effrenium voratum]|nr:unnamed protein product [Effrenium voratum]